MANEKQKPPAIPGQNIEPSKREQPGDASMPRNKKQPGDIASSPGSQKPKKS
jgi:hypothetical protein